MGTFCWRCMERDGRTSEAKHLAPIVGDDGKSVHGVHPICADCAKEWWKEHPSGSASAPRMVPLDDQSMVDVFNLRAQQ